MKKRSKRYKAILKTMNKEKKIQVKDAIELVKKNSTSKFDEVAEVQEFIPWIKFSQNSLVFFVPAIARFPQR